MFEMLAGLLALPGCRCEPPEPPPPATLDQLLALCDVGGIGGVDYGACREVGHRLRDSGRQREALRYYGAACPDPPDACVDYGLIYLRGDGVPQDLKEGFAEISRGASGENSGNARGWRALGRFLMENPNRNQRASIERTMSNSCRYSHVGWPCFNYGVALACGYLGPPDPTWALHVFDRGCWLGDPRACEMTGKLMMGPVDVPCELIGPDPRHPVDLPLHFSKADPDEPLPEGFKPFEREMMPPMR